MHLDHIAGFNPHIVLNYYNNIIFRFKSDRFLLHQIKPKLMIYSHFLTQTCGPLTFCVKLLSGYIQIPMELGIIFLQHFQLKQ